MFNKGFIQLTFMRIYLCSVLSPLIPLHAPSDFDIGDREPFPFANGLSRREDKSFSPRFIFIRDSYFTNEFMGLRINNECKAVDNLGQIRVQGSVYAQA